MGGQDKRLDVQGLRALAVGIVVLDHAGVSWMRGGFVGVDVFFVLSGFLITGLLVREVDGGGRIDLASFYARRARRILPAATVVLVAVVGFVAAELSYEATQRVTSDAGWSVAFLANVHFSQIGTDYFAQGLPPSPLQHYWSLSVEEQFYLVWPPLLVGLLLVCRRAGRSPWRVVAVVTAVLVTGSFTWSVLSTYADPAGAYFSSPARAWELGAGVLLALASRRLPDLGRGPREMLAVGGLAAVALAALRYDGDTAFPGWHALLPVLGTVAMVAAGVGPTSVGRLLSWRPVTWLGDLSYSLYLWHWPVLVLWTERTGPQRTRGETLALLLVVLALAVASHHLVENPVRHGSWWRPRLRGVVLWPVAFALVSAAVLSGQELAHARLDHRMAASRQYAALRAEHVTVTDELAASLRMADRHQPVAFPLRDLKQVDALRKDLWNYVYGCWVGHDQSQARICPVGDAHADRTIAVVGDSHAGQWLPAIDALGREQGFRVVPLVKYGCSVYDIPQLAAQGAHRYRACDDFRTWVLRELRQLHPDRVYVGSRSLPPTMAHVNHPLAVWSHGVRRFLEQARTRTPDLRVLGDTSTLAFDPIDCLTDARATMATCTSPETAVTRRADRRTARAAAQVGARYLDVLPLACLHGRCPAFAGGRMVHANADHLSVDWVRHVTPDFARIDSDR